MRLTITIPSLAAGGAERVAATLANAWSGRGDDVAVITLTAGITPFYPLDPRIVHREIGGSGASRGRIDSVANNLRRVARVRRALRQSTPDCVVSFIDQMNVTTSWAALGLGCRMVISERTDPQMAPISRGWRRLRDWSYLLADHIVMQTESAAAGLPAAARRRAVVIPNPVAVPVLRLDVPRASSRRVVLGIGRLGPEKGFDLLIEAFARLTDERRTWDLVILGDGPERPRLEQLITRHALGPHVRLPGVTSEVATHLSRADLFVLPSRFEGFPNALLEAMSHGVASIATDCRSGPREIIRPGLDGLLVPVEDVQGLANAMRQLMNHDDERMRIGTLAREISGHFSLDVILRAWDRVLHAPLPPTHL